MFEGSTRGGALSPKSDPVIFLDYLSKALMGMDGGIWAMPVDKLMSDGTVRPAVDPCTPTRVDVLSSLLSPNLAVRHTMVPGTLVSIPLVKGKFIDLPYEHVTARDWGRLFVTEQTRSGDAQAAACVALDNMTLGNQEAWGAAAHRVVLYARAAVADFTRPWASEELYFWRLITEADLTNLAERILDIFLGRSKDRVGF